MRRARAVTPALSEGSGRPAPLDRQSVSRVSPSADEVSPRMECILLEERAFRRLHFQPAVHDIWMAGDLSAASRAPRADVDPAQDRQPATVAFLKCGRRVPDHRGRPSSPGDRRTDGAPRR